MAATVFNARLAAKTDLTKKTAEFDFKLKGIRVEFLKIRLNISWLKMN